jgi:hypothetical protein
MGYFKKIPVHILLWITPCFLGATNPHETAQSVLDKLYKIHGHFNPNKPKLEITKGNQNIAMYLKSKNTIQLEEQAYQLCQSFGRDSLDALAFILGHELIHALQINNELPKTSFISYDKSYKSSLQIEQNADVQGIFVSYLAGYKTIQLIPLIIEKMYTRYGLRDKKIKGYPTEEERKQSNKIVIQQANELIELFNLANQMTVVEGYQTSIQCLEYIAKYYQGKEVYNNLGINSALMALNSTKRNTESFIYPIELDWNSRIKKPKTGRGEEDLDPLEKLAQLQWFRKAKDNFALASELDPDYHLADLNLFTVLIMMDDLKNARDFYNKYLKSQINKTTLNDLPLKIKLANAILNAKMNNTNEAIKIFADLSKVKNTIISTQAQQNLAYLLKSKPGPMKKSENQCPYADFRNIPEYAIKLRSVDTENWIALDSIYTLKKKKINNSTFYSSLANDLKLTKIQVIPLQSAIKLDIGALTLQSFGNNQWIFHCRKENEAYILNELNEVVTIIRYHHYNEVEP